MDPLNIHHVIRHRLSRIETNNFQDKSGCSINGFRSFLFEQGIVEDLDDMDLLIKYNGFIQDYRGYPIELEIYGFNNFPLSDKILRMKNVQFYFQDQLKPNHKLVSPEPHFVEEERNLLENHFSYMATSCNTDNIEKWECFKMNKEGHLVSISLFYGEFQLSNESIEHLSNFPHLKNLLITLNPVENEEYVINFSLLSNLKRLMVLFRKEAKDSELFKDLGLFSNLLTLSLSQPTAGNLSHLNHNFFIFF